MNKSFFEKPTHCQKAIMQNTERYSDIFPNTEKNPQLIAAKAIQTAGDRAANLTATKKPPAEKSESNGSSVPPASVPNDSGMDFDQQQENGNVSFDAGAGVSTQSQPYRESPIKFNDAEFGGDIVTSIDTARRFEDIEVNTLQKNLGKVANDKVCGAFINAVISELPDH